MSNESLEKARKLREQVIHALNNLSSEGPEPRYILVEERQLRNLADSLEHSAGGKTLDVIKEAVLDEKEYVEQLIKESDSMSLEEKETLMEQLSKMRKSVTQHRESSGR